eukprot:1186350-Pleurochrysis_carterae.AAC.2
MNEHIQLLLRGSESATPRERRARANVLVRMRMHAFVSRDCDSAAELVQITGEDLPSISRDEIGPDRFFSTRRKISDRLIWTCMLTYVRASGAAQVFRVTGLKTDTLERFQARANYEIDLLGVQV